MIINGQLRGRETTKVRNLRRFSEQWTEFSDPEAMILDKDDADYIGGTLYPNLFNFDPCVRVRGNDDG